jgi:mycofactocin system FadH/OYE family oxidoreductase 1
MGGGYRRARMRLLETMRLGDRTAANRVMFGPIVTNLGDDERRFTDRHTAFYARRAAGGCGIIVTEGASVHDSDWPYERAPLAQRCAAGWRAIADACHAHAALVIASLDHAGGQGSSAYSQAPLWAPSRVPEVNSRETPKWMEGDDSESVVAGFARAAELATASGCDGVEINAGQHSLVRQFLSGLTNHRGDDWADRTLLTRQVIAAVRPHTGLLGLRLSCDELAPWAGITPEMAPAIAAELAECGLDYIVVVRGAIFSAEKTRADYHEPPGYNIDVTRTVRAAVATSTAVFLQGSITEPSMAEWAIEQSVADGVEMTRAHLADPDLVGKLRDNQPHAVRPCTRCNQVCQVRDARNPIITCIGEPSTGRETQDPDWYRPTATPRRVRVIGGGAAGLEAARVAALRGHHVEVIERSASPGGLAAVAGPNGPLVQWLIDACAAAGVAVRLNVDTLTNAGGDDADGVVIQATGSLPGRRDYAVEPGAAVIDIADLRRGSVNLPNGPIAVFDPIGGPIAVALAEELGDRAHLITQDHIAGNELSRTGDLAPANSRLQQRGVRIERRSLLRTVRPGEVIVEDRFSGDQRTIAAAALVDCGFRLPDEPIEDAVQIGDCVAPRTVHEAILEARRAALSI